MVDETPGYDLLGSDEELASAFGNLASNAVRYTPPGGEVRLIWRAGPAGASFTVEDTGIALGRAIAEALGERRGIMRYASLDLAMDETLTRAAVDVSGRPFLVWNVDFSTPKVGTFDTELVREFFQAFAQNAGITLHVTNHYGVNNHHIAETCFKAVARVLRMALERDPRQPDAVPSTKGSLRG